MPYRHSLLALLIAALAACSSAGVPAPAAPVPGTATATATVDRTTPDGAALTITAADVQRRVDFLASDELRGRDTPSPGLEAAARWIADELGAMGLQPAGDEGTFIRRFPYDDSRLDVANARFTTRAGGTPVDHGFGRDFFLVPAAVDSVIGTPLWLGTVRPGAVPPVEARQRPVVFFVPDTALAAWQVAAVAALQTGMAGGASSVVLVLDPEFSAVTIGMLAHELVGQILPVPMPVVGMSYATAREMFSRAGRDLDALRGAAPEPVALDGVTIDIRSPITGEVTMSPNVVAILAGSDPTLRDEYVVYSAHFDHVGVGQPDERGDSIFNGADDNASGTSAVLEVAKAFAALDRAPARSVMFVLVSGEEKGLLGSRAFVESPPVPADRMVANINLDMVGRNAPDSIVAIGLDYSSLGPQVQRIAAANPALGLTVAPDLWPDEQLFFRSDHFSFAAAEIPAIFFTSGLHEDYHRPSDEAHRIDADKIARVARLMFLFGNDVANGPRPQWTPEGLTEVRRATQGM